MNYKSIKKNIRKIGLMFLSAGLLLFLSCGSDDTKDVSGEDGDVNSNQYLQVQPNGCLLYTSPSPRDMRRSRMPSSA